MSRLGIRLEEVVTAANQLVKEGESVTIENIRAALGGTGSYSTISKYLQAWRSGLNSLSPQAVVQTPDSVHSAVQQVWQEIHLQAKADIDKVKQDAELQIQSALERVSEAEAAKKQAEAALDAQRQAYHQSEADKALCLLDLKAMTESHALLSERYLALELRFQDRQTQTTQHLADMAAANAFVLAETEKKLSEQASAYERLISELKSQHDIERGHALVSMDQYRLQLSKKEDDFNALNQTQKQTAIELALALAQCQSLQAERDRLFDLFNEQQKHLEKLANLSHIDHALYDKLDQLLPLPNALHALELTLNKTWQAQVDRLNESLLSLQKEEIAHAS